MMHSFVDVTDDSPFSINNIPFGIFSTRAKNVPRPGVAIGAWILDVKILVTAGIFAKHCNIEFDTATLLQPTLNDFAALGRQVTSGVRLFLQHLLLDSTPILRDDARLREAALVRQDEVSMHLPMHVGDFTDFLSSRTHAVNTHSSHGSAPVDMFSPPRAFPGRASSIICSDEPVVRPLGHLFDRDGKAFVGPSRELDVELELALFIGVPNKQYRRIPITEAEDHMFGFVILNDWSTRDVQRGEDVPFAAFNAKNFASSISPWVVTLDALEPFRVKPQERGEQMLPYLDDPDDSTYNIHLGATWKISDTDSFELSRSNLVNAYWTFKQMLTHNAFAGCPMRTGDLIGSGTISGSEPSSLCSLVEKTKNNTQRIVSKEGAIRNYVEDGDEMILWAWCGDDDGKGGRVGFGDCRTVILPAAM